VCDELFADFAGRGLDFGQLHLNIIDRSKALHSAVRKYSK
jgi:hypothetical protein